VRRRREFSSWLAAHFERFVELRRASGAAYTTQEGLLLAFDRYLGVHAEAPPLSAEILGRYLVSLEPLSPRGRDNVITVVWAALGYARCHGAAIEVLPARPARPTDRHWRQRQPRILSLAEIRSVLSAARALPPSGGLRPATAATLIGLLVATGLRIGEVLALDIADLDRRHRILTVKRGKFGKSRALPLCESVCQALDRYLAHPRRRVSTSPSAPLFVSGLQQRLAAPTAWEHIRAACVSAAIAKPWPRPHDLRHTFAVGRVAAWYAQEADIQDRLLALSTYLGHVSVENTRCYLVANGLLLQHAAARFAQRTSALDQVRP
jgi:integrase